MQYPVIAFIGAGNMSSAIIGGLIESGYPAENIIAANPGADKLSKLSEDFDIRTTHDNNRAAIEAEIIVLGVKPFLIQTVCEDIKSNIDSQLIISVAAGKTITSIKQFLGCNNSVVRAMPNTPCLVSKGTIGLFADQETSPQNKQFVSSLFNNIGETVWLDSEPQMDIVTALSGSGPAYYFYLTEALIKAGVELGLKEEISTKLVNQTAKGAVAMINSDTNQTAQQLRQSVTSPNGTTEAAIDVFDNNDLMKVISDAIQSATVRGQEMSKDSS